jgi:hypothetical protein
MALAFERGRAHQDREDELHRLIGALVVKWGQIESEIDAGLVFLHNRHSADRTNADRPIVRFNFSRSLDKWKLGVKNFTLESAWFPVSMQKTLSELTKERYIRDAIVHGSPKLGLFDDRNHIECRISDASTGDYVKKTVRHKIILASRVGIFLNKNDTRNFLFKKRTHSSDKCEGSILIPFDDVKNSVEKLRNIPLDIHEINLAMQRETK